MTRRERIAELERRAASDPAGYRRRLLAIGALGYLCIGGLVGGVLAGALALGIQALDVGLDDAGFVTLILLVALGTLLARSLFVRQDASEGLALQRQDAPLIFEWIDELAPKLKAPRVGRVLLTHDFNAAVMQRGSRNELVVGLPLMSVVTAEQLKGVIAHELGHLSTGDGRLSAWVYYQRLRWERLRTQLSDPPGRWLLAPIVLWYLPWFDVWSFVQARAQERLADRGEVSTVGGETASTTHAKLALVTSWYVHRFLPDLAEAAIDDGGALRDQATRTLAALEVPVPPERLAWWLEAARRLKTDDDDTHPAMGERMEVAAPGFVPTFDGLVPDETAASVVFGDRLGEWVERLDREPDSETAAVWNTQRDRVRDARDTRGRDRGRGVLAKWSRARDRELTDGLAAAASLYREIVANDPEFGPAWDRLGRHLLDLGDDEGLSHLARAMELDPAMAPEPAMHAADILRAAGRVEDAADWERRAARAAAALWTGPLDDRCRPCRAQLPKVSREAIAERVSALPGLSRAWIVGLQPPEGPPAAVLALRVRWRWFVNVDALYDQLGDYLDDIWVPGQFEVVDLDDPDWRWLRRHCDLDGERLS